jgi:hypothetical protein
MLSYDSSIEARDVKVLEDLGFEVINPNTPDLQEACNKYINKYGRNRVMEYFKEIIFHCDLLAFRSLPEGKILSGVSVEISEAILCDIPVIELPCSLEDRMMHYPETKQYLTEIGFYKE